MTKADFANGLTASESMRVAFQDVDSANVVWHGRYFEYFEETRRTLLEKVNYSYREMLDSGFVWPVVDANVRYVRPLVLDQRFTVTACLVEWELRLVIEYRVHAEDGTLHTKARTVQVPVNSKTNDMVIGSPNVLIERVEKYLQAESLK